MPVRPLDPAVSAALEAAPLTCSVPAVTAAAAARAGHRLLERSVDLARRDFDGACADLLSWRVHEKAGLRVEASDVPLRLDTVVLMRFGLGPVSLRIPCRVVDVMDERQRRGFTYATLPGHPECGRERFTLEQRADGTIRFTVVGVSRPASLLARVGGPVSRATQDWVTRRYLRALDQL